MTAISARRGERNTVPLRATVVYHIDKRRSTDKYWIVLFVLALVVWKSPWTHVIHRELDRIIESDESTVTNGTFEFLQNKTDDKFKLFAGTANRATEFISRSWGKNWLADTIISFFIGNHDDSGSIVTAAHLLICFCLITYAFTSMRADEFSCTQYRYCFFIFIYCTFCVSIVMLGEKWFTLSEPVAPKYFCALPMVILGIIWWAKVPHSPAEEPVVDDGVKDVKHWLHFFITYPTISLVLLIIFVAARDYEFDSNIEWFYMVTLSAKCYVYLTMYCFLLMLISCATSVSFQKNGPHHKDFLRTVFLVTRYHFGTACYHATLIFPRIHSTFVVNEKEFRKIPELSAIDRLYLTHWKLHDLSLMVTAAHGHDHGKSIRELLRLSTGGSQKLKNFQSHCRIHRCYSALLIAIYGLILIALWAHGVVIEPRFSIGPWTVYLVVMCITYMIMRIFDASLDVLWFHQDENVIIVL